MFGDNVGTGSKTGVNLFTNGEFVWWLGEVVDVIDDMKQGRCKVQVFGYYDGLSKDELPWAQTIQSITGASHKQKGWSHTGLLDGSVVFGFFLDGKMANQPIILGACAGSPNNKSDLSEESTEKDGIHKGNCLGSQMTIEKAFSGQKKEKKIEYKTKYPQSLTYTTPNGIVIEYDDTKGEERIHFFHPSKSNLHFHQDGDVSWRTNKDYYNVTIKDSYEYVGGDKVIDIKGNLYLKVGGDIKIEGGGSWKERLTSFKDESIGGNHIKRVNGIQKSTTAQTEIRRANHIYLN